MSPNFSAVRNGLESAVFHSVPFRAALYPTVAADDELVTDVACIALDHLPARYHRSSDAPVREDKAVDKAVLAAYDWVYARTVRTARELVVNIHPEVEWTGAV